MILSLFIQFLVLFGTSFSTAQATYLTNHEIKLKAQQLMNSPEQILQLYVEHKVAQVTGTPSALDHLLNSIHVDTLVSHPANHSTRHVLQILTDDQVLF